MSRRHQRASSTNEPARSDVHTNGNGNGSDHGKNGNNGANGNSNGSDNNHKDINVTNGGNGNDTSFSWPRLLGVGIFFVTFLAIVLLSWSSLPPPNTNGSNNSNSNNGWAGGYAFPPRSLDDAKSLGRQLSSYSSSNFMGVLSVYMVTYIFLQTFAIPGSIFLSILSGALFNFWLALLLVSLAAAIGASMANLLSSYLGRGIIQRYLGARLTTWRAQVMKQQDNLFNYMLFLRITPFVPNFFVNIAAPQVDVPLGVFFIGTFFGVMAPSLLWIKAGQTLQELSDTGVPISTMVMLIALGFVSLIPVIFKDVIRKRFER